MVLLGPTWGLHGGLQRGGTTALGIHLSARGRACTAVFRIAREILRVPPAPALVLPRAPKQALGPIKGTCIYPAFPGSAERRGRARCAPSDLYVTLALPGRNHLQNHITNVGLLSKPSSFSEHLWFFISWPSY